MEIVIQPDAQAASAAAAATTLSLADYYRWIYAGKPAWQQDS